MDEVVITDFYNEALLLTSLQGPHILHFYGIFWTEQEGKGRVMDYYMVTELAGGGDLRHELYEHTAGRMGAGKPRLAGPVLQRLSVGVGCC